MVESISRIDPNLLAQIMGPEEIAQAPVPAVAGNTVQTGQNMFDTILNRAVESLEGVSKTEFTANDLMNKYAAGQAELSDVMIATAKMNIAVQLAVTTVTSAVNTFKEMTQMQI